MQTFAIVVSLAIAAVGIALFARAVRNMLRVIRIGTPAMNRTDQPGRRTWTLVKETLGHTRMLQWKIVGIAHWFIFVGFGLLFFTLLTAFGQLFDAHFTLPLIGEFFLYEWVSELFTVVMILAVIGFIIYRATRPKERTRGVKGRFWGSRMWQGYFVESIILGVGLCIMVLRGLEYAMLDHEGSSHASLMHFPFTAWLGHLFSGLSMSTLENLVYLVAMLKILISFTWMITISLNIDMGVAWHRFTVFFNIFLKRESGGGTALGAMKPLTNNGERVSLDDVEDLDEDATLGVGSIEDFSWKGILDFTTCTECGRCQSQCPAWNTEKPLSPKLLITALRDHAYQKAPYLNADEAGREKLLEGSDTLTREVERPLVGATAEDDWFYMPDSGAAVIDSEVLWNCTSCGACVQQCPVDIEHVDHIMDMRRYQVLVESNFPAELNGLFKGLENKGNPWNMSPSARMDWAKGLDFDVKVVGEDIESLDEVDWLFWVGCAGAYEDRQKKTTRAVAELLDMAGVSFGVLGNGETCSGDPARRAGNEFVFQGLAQQNVETFQEYKVKKVVSTCAHCFNTLKNEYKEFGVELEVVHHTQLLNRLVREGKLTPVKDGEGAHKRSITYHDPCYIGRHNGVYTPPRELLQVLPGVEYVEMERNSERAFCCGAGGARMWMEENTGERINVNRTQEAVGTGADQIAVGCPFCRVMLSDGLTAAQSKGEAREEVEVLDVAQMLLASVKGEVATKVKPGGAAPSAKAAPSESVKAEPEAGDATQATDDVVTDTEDAGPLAKASGGTSLFDTPAPDAASGDQAGSASTASSPAQEAKAATPKDQGGSLFDLGSQSDSAAGASTAESKPASGGSLFDLGGDEPAAAKTEAKAESKPTSGGSLFDLGGDEPAKTGAAATPKSEPAPAAETKAEPAPQRNETDLGSGGSLFDISTDAPAPAPAPAKSEAKSEPKATPKSEPAPAAETKAEPAPQRNETDLSSGGSLFDIQAPAAPVASAAPAAPAPRRPGCPGCLGGGRDRRRRVLPHRGVLGHRDDGARRGGHRADRDRGPEDGDSEGPGRGRAVGLDPRGRVALRHRRPRGRRPAGAEARAGSGEGGARHDLRVHRLPLRGGVDARRRPGRGRGGQRCRDRRGERRAGTRAGRRGRAGAPGRGGPGARGGTGAGAGRGVRTGRGEARRRPGRGAPAEDRRGDLRGQLALRSLSPRHDRRGRVPEVAHQRVLRHTTPSSYVGSPPRCRFPPASSTGPGPRRSAGTGRAISRHVPLHRRDPLTDLSPARRWASLAVLSASLLVVTMDLTVLNVALPDLAADLRPSATEQLWIVDAYSLVLAGLLIPMSALADRWGRKRLLLTGFAVFGVASALVLVTDSSGEVVAARALLGVGGAMIMPTTLSLLRSVFTDPAERATALGVWAGVSALGAAVGPIVGGLLLEHFSWHSAFLVNVPLMVAAIGAGALILPEARAARTAPWDVLAVALSIAGMVGLVWGVKHLAEQESLTDATGWGALVGSAVLLTAFVVRCLRRPEPLLDVRLFRRRPFTAGVIAALSAMFAMAAVLLLLAQWLQLVEGHSPLAAGVRLLPLAGGGLVASLLASPLAALVGARTVLAAGLAVAGVGALLLPLVPGELTYGTVAAAMALVGAGAGSLAIGSAMIMAGTPADRAGSAAAIEETAYDFGSVLGVAVLGSVASVVYRSHLDADAFVAQGLPAEAGRFAEDSLGAAVEVAGQARLPELAEQAAAAFTEALVDTSLVAGVVMLAVSVVVLLTAPRGLDITQQEH